ncbi:MAG: hypothetical protein [Wendovervirus sonii]|uniref:Uncharacterized protein n=1 Tax=phage Lak_Megaphage_Sonny TaxID=3109229 RepID=A0ABZ0Z3F4_9CAUD|nr:MAG: hypothetical protein [phage Lak_Megaphage_Sonny]
MNTELIKLFNAAIPEKSTVSFASVNAEAIQRGYLVEPEACTDSVYNFLRAITINPNATFYKTWNDILSKTRFELAIDQIFHYMTTYGTDFSLGNGYVPNDGDINIQDSFTNFKVIKAISKQEMFDKCYGMLKSGIALKQATMETVADYMIQYVNEYACKGLIEIDEIKNKEAITYLCDKLNIYPNNPTNLFRYIIYTTTGSTMIIKNREMFRAIAESVNPFNFANLNDEQLKGLASIFLRYKPLFLAFRHCNDNYALQCKCNNMNKLTNMVVNNKAIINKLRKMAVNLHKPMKDAFWNTVFSTEYPMDKIFSELGNLTPFKKVALMQTCIERSYGKEDQFYIVRNQKAYVRTNYKASNTSEDYRKKLYTILRMSLVEDIKKHAMKEMTVKDENGNDTVVSIPKTVKIGKGMKVALPTSEKSFIGNYPFGTSFDMSNKNSFIGIYWKNEWNTRDFDLKFIGIDGTTVGWNAAYYTDNNKIIYSGDMTNADPEASEILYIKEGCPLGIVTVNQFCGEMPSKYMLYFGNENIKNIARNYMVNPSSIKLQVEIPVEKRQMQVALVNGSKAVLMDLRTGNIPVASYNAYTSAATKSLLIKSECFINADDILADAGFNIVDSSYTGNVDIDFNNLDKDSLISIMG